MDIVMMCIPRTVWINIHCHVRICGFRTSEWVLTATSTRWASTLTQCVASFYGIYLIMYITFQVYAKMSLKAFA